MKGTPEGIRERELRLIEDAKARLERNAEGAFKEDDLAQALAGLIKFDVNAERLRKAERMLDRAKRPGSTRPSGQLMLPGFNQPYEYEPNRLVSDDDGHIIENQRALPDYKSAETRRSEENAQRAFAQFRRKAEESRLHAAWALQQALNGRPALDLTWGNCVKESGFYRDEDDDVA